MSQSPPVRGWLREACGQHVEHLPMPHPASPVDRRAPAQGVMHTIEGSLESGLAVFRQHYSPTFTVGGGRIIQHIPLGYMAAALVHTSDPPTNGWARTQIEVAGHSSQRPWIPDATTLVSLAHLLAALSFDNVAGIPLSHPFADAMPSGIWASLAFEHRRSGKWGKVAGWYGHVDVPENEHWDPGALRWTILLTRAKKIRAAHATHPRPRRAPRASKIPAALKQRFRPNDGLGGGAGHPLSV